MEEKELSSVNVIPLVDIMLVLLTIVLTTATFVVQGEIPLSLPSAREPEPAKSLSSLNIHITREGELFLGQKRVNLEELRGKLTGLDRKTPIKLRADERAEVGILVKVLDLLQSLGFEKLSMVVRKE